MSLRIFRTLAVILGIAFGFTACTGSQPDTTAAADWYNRNPLYSYSPSQGNLWDSMRKNLNLPDDTWRPQVKAQIAWFQQHQNFLNHAILESAPYIYYIYHQTQKRHLPAELALIPIIESNYNPYALSNRGAMGLWQMMPKTAQGFGLRHNRWYEGRRDLVASTNAALDYFAYLHSFFSNDWVLAIGAYDWGQGNILNSMRYNYTRSHPVTFWKLPLPNETFNYVPRLLALAAIVKSPARYHIQLVPVNDTPYIGQVVIDKPMALTQAAKIANIDVKTLKILNPALERNTTDPKGPYTLIVPRSSVDNFSLRFAELAHNEKLKWQQHLAQSEQNLATVSNKYSNTRAILQNLTPNHAAALSTPAQQRTPDTSQMTQLAANSSDTSTDSTDPTAATAATTISTTSTDKTAAQSDDSAQSKNIASTTTDNTATADDSTNQQPNTPSSPTSYTIKRGDDLSKIAHRFHTTVALLQSTNHMKGHHIKAGDTLLLPQSDLVANADATNTDINSDHVTVAANTQTKHRSKTRRRTYVIRSGDYLGRIAKRFNVSSKQLAEWNGLGDGTDLQPGTKLIIRTLN